MSDTNTPQPTGTAPTPQPNDDYLGYGVYADALWSRIENALAKDTLTGKLGDDPMVIGLFGEWGAGKSYLLGLMQDQSKEWAKKRIGWRAMDGGSAGLTVPVLFQPWKYEREEHLHVPLMMHIFSALQAYEKEAQTKTDKLHGLSTQAWEGVKKSMPSVVGFFEKILKASIAAAEPTVATASTLGLGLAKSMAKGLVPRKELPPDPLKICKYSDDGRFFYDMHEALKNVTRPTRENGQLRIDLSYPLRIDFVVFIDDLDRCLPEKAVQTLEMIKTIFNVESFAFVLALDDEVIERGIGHRYQAYNFAGKKPEMPITGFEYLEKIVHLPFKLPALTRAQAMTFIKCTESKIAAQNPHWFTPVSDTAPLAQHGAGKSRHLAAEAEQYIENPDEKMDGVQGALQVPEPVIFDLSALALDAFDAYVPRKLLRLVELWHTTVNIAQLRHNADARKHALSATSAAQVDIRIALTVLMVQLFHPDLYRVFRRHEETFKTLYNSFEGTAKPEDKLSASMSDIDLWHWAAYRQSAGNKPTELKAVLANIAALDDGYRYDAQQKRLPLVERLIEHRQAQRHVFDPLKLFASLKRQMPALPQDFKIAQYFSLLSEFDEFLTPLPTVVPPAEIPPAARGGQAAQMPPTAGYRVDLTKRFVLEDAEVLYASLIAADPNTQKGLATTAKLQAGLKLEVQDVQTLTARVKGWLDEAKHDKADTTRRQLQLLSGLQYLAPYIAQDDAQTLWKLVETIDQIGALGAPIQAIDQVQRRALWADVRAALGAEDRFDPNTPKLPVSLYAGHDVAIEPIPGFVRISKKVPFNVGSHTDKKDNPAREKAQIQSDYFVARYLTTVDQYACFVDAPDFKDATLWDTQKDEFKVQPREWHQQLAWRSRPVCRVQWFGARAYARWLTRQLRSKLDAAGLQGYEVRLPTELQWERAARATSATQSDERLWPWGDEEKVAHLNANIRQSNIGHASTVGMFPPNPVGLYDLAGNLWEWQNNGYDENTLSTDVPLADKAEAKRPALRGGSWNSTADSARCSYRSRSDPDYWNAHVGFRVVLSLANLKSET